MAIMLVLLLVSGSVVVLPSVAAGAVESPWVEPSTPVSSVLGGGAPAAPVLTPWVAPSGMVWPQAGSATVPLGEVSARLDGSAPGGVSPGGLPVSVRAAGVVSSVLPAAEQERRFLRGMPANPEAGGGGSVQVSVLGRQSAELLGVTGAVLTVRQVSGAVPADVVVGVGYAGIARNFGGGFSDRLRLVRLPGCALSTPHLVACQEQTLLTGARNDRVAGAVSAPVRLAAGGGGVSAPSVLGSAAVSGVDDGVVVLAVASGASSSQGDWKATSLAQSASWQAGASGGDFSYSIPVTVPPAAGGLAPVVSLSYSSGGVDGLTSTTSAQASWVGEGWGFEPGYVERSYRTCYDDGEGPSRLDLCWVAAAPVSLVLNGVSTRLFQDDATGVWKAEDDSAGWKVEGLLGAVNGARLGEWFKVTTRDGTQYLFGSRDAAGLGGVMNVEVFGNNPVEPCYVSGGFHYSHCTMPYRWNLDRVIDVHGNVTDYQWYNYRGNYGGNNNSAVYPYDIHAVLGTILYGANVSAGGTGAQYTGKVVFNTAARCLSSPAVCDTPGNEHLWPDTPLDQRCRLTETSCPGRIAPTFWSLYRLTGIDTYVWDAVQGVWGLPVAAVTLTHMFPVTGDEVPPAGPDSAPALWLSHVTRPGMPTMVLSGEFRRNRVNWGCCINGEQIPPMNRIRLSHINTGHGEIVTAAYTFEDCAWNNLPAAVDNNNRRCFPQYGDDPVSWWHKYVVTDVKSFDTTGGGPTQRWHYDYAMTGSSTQALWKHDQAWHTPPAKRSWTRWAGYPTVSSWSGNDDGTGPRQATETLYHRGMAGDKTIAGGWDSRVATVNDGFETATDDAALAGQTRRVYTLDGPGGAVKFMTRYRFQVTQTGTFYMVANPTIIGARVRTTAEIKRTALGGWVYRNSEILTDYDSAYGLPVKVTDAGDTSTNTDDRCTLTEYTTANTTAWIIGVPKQTLTTTCAGTPAAADYLTGQRFFYDGSTTLDATPTKGLPTKTLTLAAASAAPPAAGDYVQTSRAVFDAYGRATESYDPLDRKTGTVFTPATGTATSVAVTGPMGIGWTVTTTMHTRFGMPTKVVDANGKVTQAEYDSTGRLIKVWKNHRAPGATTGITPDIEYLYQINGANFVTTKTLGPDGQQITAHQIFDGRLRSRQTQTPSPTGTGRTLTLTAYNGLGASVSESTFYNASAPDTTLVTAADKDIKVQTRTAYDNLSRTTAAQQWTGDGITSAMLWQTSHTYDGDKTVTTTPPSGGTATTAINDARGLTVELRQHQGGTPAGAYTTITYTYDRLGQLVAMNDPGNNTWTSSYNLLGQKIQSVDPDAGTSTATFDNAGQVLSTTDGRGLQMHYTYDLLGRMTGVREDTPTSPIVSSWLYDTVDKGQLTSTTRHRGGLAYTSAVGSYDDAYRPESTTDTIPGFGTGGTTLTYTVTGTYKVNGAPATTVLPGVAGLPAETLTYTYRTYSGAPMGTTTTADGGRTYVHDTTYFSDGLINRQDLGGTGKRVRVSDAYDPASRRLTSRSLSIEDQATPGTFGTAKFQASYTYDNAANIKSIATQQNGVADQQECFTYDHLQRLTEAWTQTSGSCITAQRGGTIDPFWRQWTFNNIGNRLTQTDKNTSTGDTVWTSVLGGTSSCGGFVKAHQQRHITATGPLAGTAIREFCYDGNGSMTKRTTDTGAIHDLTWDREGHLASLADISYIYDTGGRRLIAAKPGKQTLYLPDGTELEKIGTADPLGNRYYGGYAVRDAAGLRWLAANHQNSTTYQIDPVSLNIVTRRFMPYGEPRGTQPPPGNQPGEWLGAKGYVGGVKDDTGLTHLGAREYDPTTGRFISADPLMDLDDPQQWDGYSYSNNNPGTFSDPSGLLKKESPGGAGSSKAWKLPNYFGITGEFASTEFRKACTWAGTVCSIDLNFKPPGCGMPCMYTVISVYGPVATQGTAFDTGGLIGSDGGGGDGPSLGGMTAGGRGRIGGGGRARLPGRTGEAGDLTPGSNPTIPPGTTTGHQPGKAPTTPSSAGSGAPARGAGLLKPGPWARDSIPSTGPIVTPSQRRDIQPIGRRYGCHSCGSLDPRTPSGNFIGDHQDPWGMAPRTQVRVLYPHCKICSDLQAYEVRKWQQRTGTYYD